MTEQIQNLIQEIKNSEDHWALLKKTHTTKLMGVIDTLNALFDDPNSEPYQSDLVVLLDALTVVMDRHRVGKLVDHLMVEANDPEITSAHVLREALRRKRVRF